MSKFFEGMKKDPKRIGASTRRLAASASRMSLPKPQRIEMDLKFDEQGGIMTLDGHNVRVSRIEHDPHGYQREYEDQRARAYGRVFSWALFGTPIVNKRDDGDYWVIAGQHRLAAAGYAGHTNIPVALYEGLLPEQEAWVFNQEASQQRSLTAMNKFHSGVEAGLPDHVAVAAIVQRVGGKIAYKGSPRIGNVNGITAVEALLQTYDFAGGQLLEDALVMIRDGFGTLQGPAVDGAMIKGMAQLLGIYAPGSVYGTLVPEKLLERLQDTTPEAVRRDALNKDGGLVARRFQALRAVYNRRRQIKLDPTDPDWRKVGPKLCIVPGCSEGGHDRKGNPKAGRVYRRSLCYQHYLPAKQGKLAF